MKTTEFTTKLEELFGYDLRNKKQIIDSLAEHLSMCSDDEPEEIIEEFIMENIDQEIEPFDTGQEFVEASDPCVFARHASGLFAYSFGYEFGPSMKDEYLNIWMVDLNPREDGLESPVYLYTRHLQPKWYIFKSPTELSNAEDLIFAIKRVIGDETELKRLSEKMVSEFPRLCSALSNSLSKLGVILKELPKSFDDQDGSRLFSAYRLFDPICSLLRSRISDKSHSKLDAKIAQEFANFLQISPNYPPFLLGTLLGYALSGDASKARELANQIIENSLGVRLTQRWAKLVIDGSSPFDR
jgi:hypothetical protein